LERDDVEVVDVAATDLAAEAGHVMAASMVMLGALCTVTGLVELDTVRAAAPACVPPYRRQHLDLNDRALEAGAVAVVRSPAHQAWPELARAGGRRA